ncbi:heavy-metal-associated domain-containing protein [Nonomuraea maritima]|uniref:heavy-metal-associated domain-containing protein n=1 Tax=Nonomuraea maritima TaxID=683260 RepID=UPI003722E7B1
MITVAYSLVAYRITGLSAATCDHCLAAIRSELIQVPGVVGVEIDAPEARVSILTDGPVDEEQVRQAVDEAGCTVA